MKLARANTKAFYAGREALLQRGSIITQPGLGKPKYKVETVRGSTVTVTVILPWYQRLFNRIRRGRPAMPGETLGRQLKANTPLRAD